jgi:hypothetical protein
MGDETEFSTIAAPVVVPTVSNHQICFGGVSGSSDSDFPILVIQIPDHQSDSGAANVGQIVLGYLSDNHRPRARQQ